ncbi:putative transcription factor interactor and regulator CCHC(Zn) family [Lupinus albus]|uniref:Putative transcription factor interactor and regulator CCHC(Zn) family n=1 Tax=Lupinus albus TaxID=3870 RepID=A0A6A4R1B1_LUPAL|nr:putative transcription factor interactor and regulator CCHC(Zn) family [Lupinus albus]
MEGAEKLNEDGYGGEAGNNRSEECRSESLDKEENLVEDEKIEIENGEDLDVGFEVIQTVVMSEEVKAVSSIVHAENKGPNGSLGIDGRSVSGAKRARVTIDEHQPSVHFIYNSLTRASRQKLEELLQQWSEWHEKHASSSNDPSEVLESGEETFFPALKVGHEETSAVPFWMDNQTINDQNKDFIPLNHNSVPLYDRGYALGLKSADGPSNLDGGLKIIDAAARCFNCGSYSHSLRECTRPRDNVAVNNARKELKSRRNQNASSRNPTRYYQSSPTGKYSGLRPGALDDVTRQLLGLGELDPPPWLKRMREIGYPPGYLDVDDEDEPSGITIYTDREIAEQEDGEIMEVDKSKPKRKMAVEFPGMNAPIPENADERLWAAGAGSSNYDISRNLPQHRSNHSTDYGSRGHFRDQRLPGDFRDDAPPGDPGFSSSRYSFHPRYGGHDSVQRSPPMSRFQSEWSRRSPLHDEESPHPSSFHSLYYSSSSERLPSPRDRDSGRYGNRTSGSLYDRDRDRPSQNRDMSEDRHYRSRR